MREQESTRPEDFVDYLFRTSACDHIRSLKTLRDEYQAEIDKKVPQALDRILQNTATDADLASARRAMSQMQVWTRSELEASLSLGNKAKYYFLGRQTRNTG